jgi:hypothetical protein
MSSTPNYGLARPLREQKSPGNFVAFVAFVALCLVLADR